MKDQRKGSERAGKGKGTSTKGGGFRKKEGKLEGGIATKEGMLDRCGLRSCFLVLEY